MYCGKCYKKLKKNHNNKKCLTCDSLLCDTCYNFCGWDICLFCFIKKEINRLENNKQKNDKKNIKSSLLDLIDHINYFTDNED